jgi:hypothetical protein
MAAHRFKRLEELEDQHPGLCRQVEQMFRAYIPVRAIARALRAQYGPVIGEHSLYLYRKECWGLWATREPRPARRASRRGQPAIESQTA